MRTNEVLAKKVDYEFVARNAGTGAASAPLSCKVLLEGKIFIHYPKKYGGFIEDVIKPTKK